MSINAEVNTVAMEISPELIETIGEERVKVKTSDDGELLPLERSSSAGNSLLGKTASQISLSIAVTNSNVAIERHRFEQLSGNIVVGPSFDDTILNISDEVENEDDRLDFPGIVYNGESALMNSLQERSVFDIFSNTVFTKCNIPKNFLRYEQFSSGIVDFPYLDDTVTNTSADFENEDDNDDPLNSFSWQICEISEKAFQERIIQEEMRNIEKAKFNIISIIVQNLKRIDKSFPNCELKYIAELESFKKRLQKDMQCIESLGHDSVTECLIKRIGRLQMLINSKLTLCQQIEDLRRPEKEKEIIQQNVNSPLSPIAMGQEERTTYSTFSSDALSAEDDVRKSDNEPQEYLINLNDFIQDIKIRWGDANRAESYVRRHFKDVILQEIDLRLIEAERRGESVEASDLACAEMIQIKENIMHEIKCEEDYLAIQNFFYQSTFSLCIAESYCAMDYPIPVVRHTIVLMCLNSTNANDSITSSPSYIQQSKVNQRYPHKFSKCCKIKRSFIKSCSKIKSFLKHRTPTSDNSSV